MTVSGGEPVRASAVITVHTYEPVAYDEPASTFVGVERVTGKVAGKEGTFVLQDAGTVEGDVVSGEWFVVPGSGTGELAGLRGTGGYLDHWFQ